MLYLWGILYVTFSYVLKALLVNLMVGGASQNSFLVHLTVQNYKQR